MSKAKELIASLAGLFESLPISDTKKKVLSRALKHPHGTVSVTTLYHRGIRHGGREAQAMSDLHHEGHLEHISTQRESEKKTARSRTKDYLVSTYKLTDKGRDLANKHKEE